MIYIIKEKNVLTEAVEGLPFSSFVLLVEVVFTSHSEEKGSIERLIGYLYRIYSVESAPLLLKTNLLLDFSPTVSLPNSILGGSILTFFIWLLLS